MGIADAFGREDRMEVKVASFIEMTQAAAEAEVKTKLLMNAVNCEVPYRYIREVMTGVSEEPKADPGQEEELSKDTADWLHRIGQRAFEVNRIKEGMTWEEAREEFVKIFGRNYL